MKMAIINRPLIVGCTYRKSKPIAVATPVTSRLAAAPTSRATGTVMDGSGHSEDEGGSTVEFLTG
jgi:hypothetical protein